MNINDDLSSKDLYEMYKKINEYLKSLEKELDDLETLEG